MTLFSSGISMYALGLLFHLVLGWSFTNSVLLSAAIVLVYTFLGGLTSAIYNEVLQFFLIVLGIAPLAGLAVWRAASGRQCRQYSCRALAGGGAAALQGRRAIGAGYRLGGMARGRGHSGQRASPPVLSARARRQDTKGSAAESLAAICAMMAWLSELWSGGTVAVEPASLRDAPKLAELHGASFHRGWGEGEFEAMLIERNTLVHRMRMGRKTIGFAVSRMAADEAEILSIAVDAGYRGRGLSRNLLLTHLGHLAGRGVRSVFLEVEENNQPARRLYQRAGFAIAGRRERYYRQASGEQLNALLMRRDLS